MSLFNVLPPRLDLLVPPPAEAPQLAPIYRLGVLCVNQETMQGLRFLDECDNWVERVQTCSLLWLHLRVRKRFQLFLNSSSVCTCIPREVRGRQ